MQFFEKLAEIEKKYDELNSQLGSADVLADPARYQKAAKAHSDLREVVEKFRQWKDVQKSLAETKALLEESGSDAEMRALAQEEFERLKPQQEQIEGGEIRLQVFGEGVHDSQAGSEGPDT